MLDKQQLLEHIGTALSKTKVDKLRAILTEQQFRLTDLIDLTFHTDDKIAFRAAWLLENVFLRSPEAYLHDVVYLANKFELVTSTSCARHYAKIAMHITSPKADKSIAGVVSEINLEPMVETCFNLLTDPKIPVAVKSFAAQALFDLSPRCPWIREELKEQLIFLMKDGSAAIQSRGNKLLAKL